jgi:hypothetical protein
MATPADGQRWHANGNKKEVKSPQAPTSGPGRSSFRPHCDGSPVTHQLDLRALQHFLSPRCLSAPNVPSTQHSQLSSTPLSCRDTLGTRVLCRRSPALLSPHRLPATIHTYRPCADSASTICRSLFRSTGALYARAECPARLGGG